ncbi:hypothetical protein PIB30_096621 [Stylosanthes scabra]|uniref:Uncharacterized protein n=1 Tax=Stylosanthes scabra TaxID=79078 RepID=A0ABU6VUR0_9FABA|nr:hypothetical protein [Stylosanthes scabra]
MSNTSSRGKRMLVEKARTRRDNIDLIEHETRRQVVYDFDLWHEKVKVIASELVHGRKWDPSAKLMMINQDEDGKKEEPIKRSSGAIELERRTLGWTVGFGDKENQTSSYMVVDYGSRDFDDEEDLRRS